MGPSAERYRFQNAEFNVYENRKEAYSNGNLACVHCFDQTRIFLIKNLISTRSKVFSN
jgi:hypothetical protein